MGKVIVGATVSLDGYVSGPGGTGMQHLFAWFEGGDVEIPSGDPDAPFMLTESDARYMRDLNDSIGAYVIGRRTFDDTDGWGGTHPFHKPVVVVTHRVPEEWVAGHPGASVTFVTDGLVAALDQARALAGDLDVVVTPGSLMSQCLELGLLDEVSIDLVPVMLGGGVPFVERLTAAPILLDGPTLLLQGKRVTHLRYTVRHP